MPPVLEALHALGGSGRPREVTEWVAEHCKVADKQQEALTETGVPRFYNQVAWARQYLVWAGLLSSQERGVWLLTPKGRETHLDHASALELFRECQARHQAQRTSSSDAPPAATAKDADDTPAPDPESALLGELLLLLRRLTPKGFEEFCGFLLRRSGFEQVTITGASHDGGIDGHGVVKVNPFVSFKVVFQCKRYVGTVSRAQVGDLRNAMIGRAEKGIMITTGIFSEDARREATRVGAPPIELIDGSQLVALLAQEGIGVVERTVRDIDQAFFAQYGLGEPATED